MRHVLILVFATATTACDPCEGVDGSCVNVHVDGSGAFDQLMVAINGDYTNLKPVPVHPKQVSLPQSFSVGSNGGMPTSVTVFAYLKGNLVGDAGGTFTASGDSSGNSATASLTMQLCQGAAPALCGDPGQCVANVSSVSTCDAPPPPDVSSTGGDGSTGSSGSTEGSSTGGSGVSGNPTGTEVASGFDYATDLQVPADGKLYWTTSTQPIGSDNYISSYQLWVYDPVGTAAPSVDLNLPAPPEYYGQVAVATDASNRYIACGTIATQPLAGGNATVIAGASGSAYGTGLQVVGTTLYVAQGGTAYDSDGEQIDSLAVTGGAVSTWIPNGDTSGINSLAAIGTQFYWGYSGGVATAAVGGSSYQDLGTGTAAGSSVVATANNVAWIQGNTFALYFPGSGDGLSVTEASVGGVALSTTHIVWSATIPGSYSGVFAAPLPAPTATTLNLTTLAITDSLVGAVAIAGGKAFWFDSKSGTEGVYSLMTAALP